MRADSTSIGLAERQSKNMVGNTLYAVTPLLKDEMNDFSNLLFFELLFILLLLRQVFIVSCWPGIYYIDHGGLGLLTSVIKSL